MSRPSPNRASRVVAVGAVTAGVAVAAVLVSTSGDDDAYVVKAEFKDAAGLRKNSDVKIGGVPAGRISDIELTPRDTALVTMKLDSGKGNTLVGAGATADARPVNLLGEKYVDLNPGDLERQEPSETTIPASRTDAPVELDQVLNTLDPTTRGQMRVLINEAGIGMAGRSEDFNAILDRMPPTLREARKLVASFAADRDQLRRLADQGDRVLTSFHAGRTDLADLIGSAERTFAVTSAAREDLGRTLDAAPASLRQLRATLETLRTASGRLTPAAAELRRTAGPLAGSLERLPKLASDAAPTLKTAKDVAPAITKLGQQATPPVQRLETPARELERFSTFFTPLSSALANQTNPLLRVLEGWARTIQVRDGVGHIFRLEVIPDEELLTRLVDGITTKPDGDRPQDPGPSPGAEGTPLARRAPGRGAAPKLERDGQGTGAATTTSTGAAAATPTTPDRSSWLTEAPRELVTGLLDRLGAR
ncbi:MlaD family protein [Patulibacter brassicae]|uniref:MlaD family protein n=1 Tax=Patulibacter brassicae TaxID=1705717 RepID=A0ABU4VG00_9ACTN|nr:MlaD family protein [Patulibacter brassicae]MDX8150713.1 MlaD family protein [Patulibacter brassicae]